MNQASFNVLKEPWIPVVRRDDSRDELGILSCLEQAHQIREIRDPSPIVEFGIYRLLVAFVLDVLIIDGLRPEDPLDLKELIRQGRFDMATIERYATNCGDVFNVFDPHRPFLQVAMPQKPSKSVAAMNPTAPSGTNAGLWHHVHEDDAQLTLKEATRWLTSIAPFMTSGGAGLSPSINGAPAIYTLPIGSNLYETLILNLPLRKQEHGDGIVAWRNTREPGTERSQATTPEALTWRPRRVQFIPCAADDGQTVVRRMRFEKGDSTRLTWVDCNLAYRYDNDKESPIRMREGRPLWRDAGPLLLLHDTTRGDADKKAAFCRPDVVQQAFELVDPGRPLQINAYGVRTDMKMKVFEWVRSSWTIPTNLGRSTRLGSLVHQELDRAEQVAYRLRTCIKSVYPREGAGNKDALRCVGTRCERAYWLELERQFQPLMSTFAALDPNSPDDPELISGVAQEWRSIVSKSASDQFESAAKDMDVDGDALERLVSARAKLRASLKKVLS